MKKLIKGIGNFLTKNAANPAEGIANTLISVVKDKTRDPETSFIRDVVRKGVSISSKRVLNLTGTSAIIITALSIITAKGEVDKWSLGLIAIGVVYSAVMTWLTQKAEKGNKGNGTFNG